MKTIWQVEWDLFARKVLEKHWPGVPKYEDIKTVDFKSLPKPDLICGGFPCQPISCAGKRKGDKDERWLWSEFYRAICETQPKWVLVENVPGLLSICNGRLFGGILRDLAKSRYDAEWDLLPAAAFGAPHLRYRLFLVAHSSGFHDIQCFEEKDRWELEKYFEFGRRAAQKWIQVATEFRGMDDEISKGLDKDRLKCLGNAVVPQVAEWIGKKIIECDNYKVTCF